MSEINNLKSELQECRAEIAHLRRQQEVSNRYPALRTQAEALVADGRMLPDEFGSFFSDDAKKDIQSLISSDELPVLERCLQRCAVRKPTRWVEKAPSTPAEISEAASKLVGISRQSTIFL